MKGYASECLGILYHVKCPRCATPDMEISECRWDTWRFAFRWPFAEEILPYPRPEVLSNLTYY